MTAVKSRPAASPVARSVHSASPPPQSVRSQPVHLERPPHSTSPPPRPNRLEQPPRPVHLDPPPRPARPAQIFRRLCLTALLSLGGLLLPAQAQAQDAGICARTAQVQTAILEVVRRTTTVADCGAVTAAHLSGITTMTVAGASSLQSGDFAGLSGLTSLGVRDGSLTSLPAGLLSGLSALTTFIVEATSVRTVPANLFSDTTGLTTVWIRRSQLAALPAGLFAGLDFSGADSALRLDRNPGSPFTLGLRVERQTSGSFRVRVVEGAPGPMTVDWARPGISGTLNISAGRVTSLQFSTAGPLPTLSNPRFTSGAGNYDGIAPGILTVSGTALSETTLTLAEDGAATYTVALSGLPQTPVTITPASDNPDVTISPAALIFSAANWNVAQTVTLSAVEDDDLIDDTANITHALSGADYPGGASGDSLVATVTDTTPDTPPTFGALSQPDQAYTGRIQIPDLTLPLATAGNGDITYTLTPTIATAVPGLAFDAGTRVVSGTPSAVLTATTVTLTYTAHDADDNTAAADAATLTFAITVNPGVGVVFSPAALEIFEEGAGGAYTVALNTDPGAGFTVRIQPEGDARMTFVPAGALEFTTANWNTPQVVNVSAGADTNRDNETVPVEHTVTATGAANPYTAINGVSAGALPVTVFDDDHYVTFFNYSPFGSVDALELNEGSAITLNLETAGSIGQSRLESARIVPDDGGLTVTTSAPYPFNLRFFPAFTVTFTANEDGDAVDNTYRYVVRYTPQIGGDRATREFSFPITVTDTIAPTPATLPAVTIAPTTLTIDEGAMDTYTVTLATNPGGAVTVTPASSNTTDVPTPSALTFAAAEWNTAQTVTVTANEDADAADESANITHTVAGYTGVTAADNDPLRVTVDDDETAGVTLSENSLELGEDDSDNDLVSDTYEVTLDTPPSAGNVVVTPVSSDTGIAAVSPAALTFDDGNWNIAQVVTISAVADPDDDDGVATINHTVTVTVGGAAEYDGIAAGDVEVDVYDTLVGGIVFAPASLTVTEGGSGIYTVALSIIPSGEVTIPLQVTTASLATFEPAAGLTFSPGTWNIPQTVTVGTTTDPDARRNPNALVRHQASGGGYDASPAGSYAVVITETGSIGVSISTPTLTVDEGDFASYTVALTSPPSIGEVTVTPGSADTGAVLVTTAALVFDAADWNMPQTVSVQGVADADSADESVVITHEVTVTDASSEYDGATAAAVTVTVTDAPPAPAGGPAFAAGVTVDDQIFGVGRRALLVLPPVDPATPGVGTITYALAPDVTVAVPGTRFVENTRTLTGTPSTEAAAVTLTYTATDDDGNVARLVFAVTVITPEVLISDTTVTIIEGVATGAYTVRLSTNPNRTTVVTPVSGDPALLPAPDELSFTALTWQVPQTVTLTSVPDTLLDDGVVTITHTLRGYGGVTSVDSVVVTITNTDADTTPVFSATETVDDQIYAVDVPIETLTLPEATGVIANGDLTYTLTPDVATLIPGLTFRTSIRLTFDRSRPARELSGTPTAATASPVTLTYTATDAEGDSVSSEFTVAVTAAGVVISPLEVDVYEQGANEFYTVVLDTFPGNAQSVRITIAADPGISLTPPQFAARLDFSAADWNTPQTVRVNAPPNEDGNEVDEEGISITHTVSGAGSSSPYFRLNGQNVGTVVVNIRDDDHAVEVYRGGTQNRLTEFAVDEGGSGVIDIYPPQFNPPLTFTGAEIFPNDGGVTFTLDQTLPHLLSSFGQFDFLRVTFTAHNDLDTVSTVYRYVQHYTYQGTARSYSFRVTATDTGSNAPPATPPAVTIAPLTLEIEEGAMDTYTVTLATDPGGEVVVTPASDNTADVPTPSALTFAAGAWNTPQMVTVTTNADVLEDFTDETAIISHTVTGYAAAPTPSNVVVTVDDNDTDSSPNFAGASVPDQNYTATFTVVNLSLPAATGGNDSITYTLTPDIATAIPGLVFDENARTVTGTPSAATAAQGVRLTYTAADTDNNTADSDTDSLTFAITVEAAPVAVVLQITPPALTIDEGGMGVYTVQLSAPPVRDAEVQAVTIGAHDLTLTQAGAPLGVLIFGPSNWNNEQTVTVAAATDADRADDIVIITHTVSLTDIFEVRLTVTVNDTTPDTAPAFAAQQTDQTYTTGDTVDLTLPEAIGGDGDLTYALEPSGDIPAGLTFDAGERTLSGTANAVTATTVTLTYTATDTDGDTASLTFAVTVQAVPDTAPAFAGGAVADDQTFIAGTQITPVVLPAVDPANAGNGAPVYTLTPDITVAIPGLTFTAGTRTLSGTPTTATTAAVTLTYTLADSDTTTGAADEASLTFAITVNNGPPVAVDDAAAVDTDSTIDIADGAAGDLLLNDSDPDGDTLTIIGVDSSPGLLRNRFVGVGILASGGGTITIHADGSWSYDPGTAFNSLTLGQTGTATAVYRVSDGNGNTDDGELRITVTRVADPDISPAFASGEVVDDQTYTTGEAVDLTLPEATGGNGDLTYALEPSGDIPAGLTFDAGERTLSGTANAVTATAVTLTYTATDTDGDSDSLTFAVTVNPAAPVTPPALVFDVDELTVDEGASGAYTVELSVAPTTGNVTVTPDATTGLTFAPAALTFSATSWDTAQDIVITAAPDDDTLNETVAVSHTVNGAGNYAALSAAGGGDVTVTVTDTSIPAVTISPTTLSVNEGESDIYTVRLATIPLADVVITPNSAAPAVATVSPTGGLTFTAGNWSDEQTVTVTGVADADAVANAAAIIVHSATSTDTDYDALAGIDAVRVTVTETDSVGFTVTPPTLALNEGDSGFYTVVLTSVTVTDPDAGTPPAVTMTR